MTSQEKATVDKYSWKHFLSSPRLPAPKYDTRCHKMFPLLIRGKGTRAESSERRMERRAQPTVAVKDGQGNKSSTVCLSPLRSPANAEWVCDWGTSSQEPKQHLLSPWKSALSAPVACVSSREGKSTQSTGWPLKHRELTLCHKESLLLITLMSSKSHTDYKEAKRPSMEHRNTHHDDQENILEVLLVAERVGDEKGKISLQ